MIIIYSYQITKQLSRKKLGERLYLIYKSKNKEDSETVEKVPKQILGEDAEKNDFTECATVNDLTITKGHERPPKNHPLSILKGFSTVLTGTCTFQEC